MTVWWVTAVLTVSLTVVAPPWRRQRYGGDSFRRWADVDGGFFANDFFQGRRWDAIHFKMTARGRFINGMAGNNRDT